jgi:outer membrane receptor protein involved in Fe transport
VLNLGLRLDVFDNNSDVLIDPFALVPIVRAEVVPDRPTHIADDFAVYYNSEDQVVGYRDLDGHFFSVDGESAEARDILTLGDLRIPEGFGPVPSSAIFEDAAPQFVWMPRVGVSFPVTDKALFFAHYDVTSQRPSSRSFASLHDYYIAAQGFGFIGNTALLPQKTTEYEIGFRQRLGSRTAFMVSGFYKKIDNLIQYTQFDAFPNQYGTFESRDFGTVKGVQLEFDLRRTGGIAVNANYTIQFAEGTGSSPISAARGTNTGFIPDFIFPTDFDRRHSINAALDYRLGKGQGPTVAGKTMLEYFGLNLTGRFFSGLPYTSKEWPGLTVSGDLNAERMDWSNRVDLRINRQIPLSGRFTLDVFMWIQNLFDSYNVIAVYSTTGLAENDGWLVTREGENTLQTLENRICGSDCRGETIAVAETVYGYKQHSPWSYGIPRMTRFGIRANF